jgi:hypothetical protein
MIRAGPAILFLIVAAGTAVAAPVPSIVRATTA